MTAGERPPAPARDPALSGTLYAAAGPPLLPWMRWVLRAAGCYNLLVGVQLVLFVHEVFKIAGLEKPRPVMYVQLVGMLVGLFGVGYLLVAARPLENRMLLWLGLASKAMGCLLTFYHVARGTLDFIYLPIVIFSDLVWLPPFFLIARRLDHIAAAARGDADA